MEDVKEKRGRGRPRLEMSKHSNCNVRFDTDHEFMLGELTYHSGKSRSDIMRDALKLYYNINKNKF